MSSPEFDVIVVGLGVMGGSIAGRLARSGRRVLGLDRHRPPHVHGSSHGHTRATREVYGDDDRYVLLVQRTNQAWRRLQDATGTRLLVETGILLMGAPQSPLIRDSEAAAQRHGIANERLDREQISRRWPQFRTSPDMCGLWDPSGAILLVEPCIEALLAEAQAQGAALRFGAAVQSWRSEAEKVTVHTTAGTYEARQLVLAAGPWCGALLPELHLPLRCERHVQYWFEPLSDPQLFAPGACPIYSWQHNSGTFYGFANLGHGIKVAHHHSGEFVDPDALSRDVSDHEVNAVRALLQAYLPAANGPLIAHDACLYTNTPDLHFIIDFHPDHPNVLIVGGCSGHGFKFGPVVGEIAEEMLSGKRDPRLDMFRLNRLRAPDAQREQTGL